MKITKKIIKSLLNIAKANPIDNKATAVKGILNPNLILRLLMSIFAKARSPILNIIAVIKNIGYRVNSKLMKKSKNILKYNIFSDSKRNPNKKRKNEKFRILLK